MCVSRSVVSSSLQPHEQEPARLLHPWNSSPGKNTRVGGHFLFLTQRSNPGLRQCRQILLPLSHEGSPIEYVPRVHFNYQAVFCNISLMLFSHSCTGGHFQIFAIVPRLQCAFIYIYIYICMYVCMYLSHDTMCDTALLHLFVNLNIL